MNTKQAVALLSQDKSIRRRFIEQKSNAKRRKIEWRMTLNEWVAIWWESGHLFNRGKRGDEYQLCRFGDTGPYSADNCYVDTASNNVSAAHKGKPKSEKHAEFLRRMLNRVSPRKRVYVNTNYYPSITDAAKAHGIPYSTMAARINSKSPVFDSYVYAGDDWEELKAWIHFVENWKPDARMQAMLNHF